MPGRWAYTTPCDKVGVASVSSWAGAASVVDPLGAYSVHRATHNDDEQRLLETPVGRIAFAGEHTAGDGWVATLEGALRSGRRAAADAQSISARGARSGGAA